DGDEGDTGTRKNDRNAGQGGDRIPPPDGNEGARRKQGGGHKQRRDDVDLHPCRPRSRARQARVDAISATAMRAATASAASVSCANKSRPTAAAPNAPPLKVTCANAPRYAA